MKITLSATVTALSAASLFALVGCSSAQKSVEPAAPTPSATAAVKPPVNSSIRQAQSSGSLSDLREGRQPATPKENPLREIYFDFDKYDLKSEARQSLKSNADWLIKNPTVTVQIEGHCDERGTSEYNLALGAKRAAAAKDYLQTLGIPATRLSTVSYGSEIPVCREHTEECWQKNRRDRFVASSPKPSV